MLFIYLFNKVFKTSFIKKFKNWRQVSIFLNWLETNMLSYAHYAFWCEISFWYVLVLHVVQFIYIFQTTWHVLDPLVIPYKFSSKRYVVINVFKNIYIICKWYIYVNVLILFISIIKIFLYCFLNLCKGENKTDGQI